MKHRVGNSGDARGKPFGEHPLFMQKAKSHNRDYNNQGFDTVGGFYKVIQGDHLGFRYETLKEIGRGTFGQVIQCIDHKTGKHVAIKISKNLRIAGLKNCMREIHMLERVSRSQTIYS